MNVALAASVSMSTPSPTAAAKGSWSNLDLLAGPASVRRTRLPEITQYFRPEISRPSTASVLPRWQEVRDAHRTACGYPTRKLRPPAWQ